MKLFRLALGTSIFALGCAVQPAMAQSAAPATAHGAVNFDISEQPLAEALTTFARNADVQFAYSAELVAGRTAQTVKGSYTVQEALARMLSGTGLTWRFSDGRTIVLEAAVTGDGSERVLGAVRVQGVQGGSSLAGSTPVNGINGSRDVTATEGTGSYTSNALTVGSKTAQSIKDTPMAVSVITNAQMQDQNITDLNSAMRDAPGITVVHNTASDLGYFSRGFAITQLQIDGGAAQNFTANTFYQPIIDMSLYDHVEIVRGAAGTFNGYGAPGGVLNLVRKRPLDHPQMLFDLQLGSWDWHRVSVDVTGPLAFDGKLRARIIGTHQDNNYFYETAKANRSIIAGTLEWDLTPTTLVSVGANYQDQKDTPWYSGLMRYQTGKAIAFPRSTCLCFSWADNNRSNLELYSQIEQRLGSDWNLKLKATRISQRSYNETPYVEGTIDPANGRGAVVGVNVAYDGHVRQTQFEATLDGSFKLFGQTQKLILGANYSMSDPGGSGTLTPDFSLPNFANGSQIDNIFAFKSDDWQPASHVYALASDGYEYGDIRYLNAYASLELTPFARFHINTSIRYSGYRNRSLTYVICNAQRVANNSFTCGAKGIGSKVYLTAGRLIDGNNISWPPSIQAKYDVNANLTAYAAYTDIYVDRSSYINADGHPLPPTTGANYEGGLKWQSDSKKLNVTLSSYYTKQINVDVRRIGGGGDQSNQDIGQLNQQVYCCYVNLDGSFNLSYGVDAEISGELYRGLQISASYTYNDNKVNRPGRVYYDGSAQALQSFAPHHMFKLWSSYEFDDRSSLNGLRLGFGVQARSKTFVQDSYCPQTPLSESYGPQCPVDPLPVFFSDPGYVVFNGSVGYKISNKLRIDAELENLLDKTYYDQVGRIYAGNWYGAPRSIKVSLRGTF